MRAVTAAAAALSALLLATGEAPAHAGSTCAEGACDTPEEGEVALLHTRLSHAEAKPHVPGAKAALEGLLEQGAWLRASGRDPEAEDDARTAGEAANFANCSLSECDCPLWKMRGPTLVYPGGETKCINGDDYAFLVIPGAWNKLLFYFEGGGACWESNGAFGKVVVRQCSESLQDAFHWYGYGRGVLNSTDKRNPFRGYTTVQLLYCSGDAFIGNTTMVDAQGVELVQRGYFNAQAALEWTKRNFHYVEQLTVAGFSAGSLGVMAWTSRVLDNLKHRSAAVLLDSYVGLSPGSTGVYALQRWGGCGTMTEGEDERAACEAGQISAQDSLAHAIRMHPKVAFGSIQSKADSTQVWFYQGIAQSWGLLTDAGIGFDAWYLATLPYFRTWNQFPNYVAYFVDGTVHCFLQSPAFYTASTAGPSQEAPEGDLSLYEWVDRLLEHKAVPTECDGPVLALEPVAASDAAPGGGQWQDTCDEALLPKVLVAPC